MCGIGAYTSRLTVANITTQSHLNKVMAISRPVPPGNVDVLLLFATNILIYLFFPFFFFLETTIQTQAFHLKTWLLWHATIHCGHS